MFLQELLAHKKAVQRMGKKSKVGAAAVITYNPESALQLSQYVTDAVVLFPSV
jgi:hypothetical protein